MEEKGQSKTKSKSMYIAAAVVLILALSGLGYLMLNAASGPVVANGDTVKVYYTGKLTNGTVFDSNVGGQPLQFTVGAGEVITGFDQAVIGMQINQSKNVTIPVNKAYGPVNPQLIISVPSNSFGNQTVQVGMSITERTTSGQVVQGRIVGLNTTNVLINFNPPLAGQTLIFNIKVVAVQKNSK